jgi:hypothetical protein
MILKKKIWSKSKRKQRKLIKESSQLSNKLNDLYLRQKIFNNLNKKSQKLNQWPLPP